MIISLMCLEFGFKCLGMKYITLNIQLDSVSTLYTFKTVPSHTLPRIYVFCLLFKFPQPYSKVWIHMKTIHKHEYIWFVNGHYTPHWIWMKAVCLFWEEKNICMQKQNQYFSFCMHNSRLNHSSYMGFIYYM